jgi:hypothetical protein
MIAMKERERADNARFASNVVYSRGQPQSQLTLTQIDPAEPRTSGSLANPPIEDKRQQPEADARYKRPLEANIDSGPAVPDLQGLGS